MSDAVAKVADLLHEAGETHHTVFRITDGDDPDWASWYGDWLIRLSELPQILGTTPVRSELARLMREMRKWMVRNRARVMETLSSETGKPHEDAQLELFYCVDALGFWAKRAHKWLADEHERPHSPLLLGRKVVSRYVPYGAVGVIGPWNYPLLNNFGDAIPALMAGNTLILQPPSVTPLSTLPMAAGRREVRPPAHALLGETGRRGRGRGAPGR